MSAYEIRSSTARNNPAHYTPRVTIAQLFLRAVQYAVQRWQRRRAIAELESLSDRELKDIGIARHDIPRAVDGLIRSRDGSSEGPRRREPAGPPSGSERQPEEQRKGSNLGRSGVLRLAYGGNDGHDNENDHRSGHVRADVRGFRNDVTTRSGVARDTVSA
ncbi:MAG TPA: DUF1127 domain-containing protein [Hyphomicrobiaceae bacterium]